MENARVLINRLKHSGRRRDSLGQARRRSMKSDSRTERILHLCKRLGYEYGEITGRLARFESRRGFGYALDAIDTECAPVLAARIPRRQIPTVAGVHHPVWFDCAHAGRSRPILVVKANRVVVTARAGNQREQVGIDTRPTRFQRNDVSVQGSYTLPQTRGQYLFEFQKSSYRGLLNARDASIGSGTESESDGHCFIVVEQKWRKRRTCPKLVSAGNTGRRVDRVSKAPQPVNIAPQGTTSDVETNR